MEHFIYNFEQKHSEDVHIVEVVYLDYDLAQQYQVIDNYIDILEHFFDNFEQKNIEDGHIVEVVHFDYDLLQQYHYYLDNSNFQAGQ